MAAASSGPDSDELVVRCYPPPPTPELRGGSDPGVSHRQDCVEQLLGNMFDGDQTESCLVSGTQVLLALLEARRAG